MKPVYNIDALLGYELFSNILGFVEGGVSFANEKIYNKGRIVVHSDSNAFNHSVYTVTDGYKTRYNVGLGASYQPKQNWLISGELIYNDLGNYKQTEQVTSRYSIIGREAYQLTTLMMSVSYLIPC